MFQLRASVMNGAHLGEAVDSADQLGTHGGGARQQVYAGVQSRATPLEPRKAEGRKGHGRRRGAAKSQGPSALRTTVLPGYYPERATGLSTPPSELDSSASTTASDGGLPPPPASVPEAYDDLPSRGSKNHTIGKCRPCALAFSATGCPRGSMCNFCHFEHSHDKFVEAAMYSAKASLRRAQRGHTAAPQSTAAPSAAPPVPPPPSSVPWPQRLSPFGDMGRWTAGSDCDFVGLIAV